MAKRHLQRYQTMDTGEHFHLYKISNYTKAGAVIKNDWSYEENHVLVSRIHR